MVAVRYAQNKWKSFFGVASKTFALLFGLVAVFFASAPSGWSEESVGGTRVAHADVPSCGTGGGLGGGLGGGTVVTGGGGGSGIGAMGSGKGSSTRGTFGGSGGKAGGGGGGASGGGGANCGSNSPGCFVGETVILMADSTTKPIKDVRVGDLVMAFDEAGHLVPQKVEETFIHENKNVISLNGVYATEEHPFLTGSGVFTTVGELKKEDSLVDAKGTPVSGWSMEPVDGTYTVYNIRVENLHTYIAGGYRVHNK